MISELPISVTPISESSDCDIRKIPTSGAVISGKTVISQLARIQMRIMDDQDSGRHDDSEEVQKSNSRGRSTSCRRNSVTEARTPRRHWHGDVTGGPSHGVDSRT